MPFSPTRPSLRGPRLRATPSSRTGGLSPQAPGPSARFTVRLPLHFLHLAVLTPFLLRPAPGLPDDVRQLGMKDGAPEHLNVSLVSEADSKRLSSDPFRQEAPPSPTPAETPGPPPEPQAAPQPPQPPAKEASAAESPRSPMRTRKVRPSIPQVTSREDVGAIQFPAETGRQRGRDAARSTAYAAAVRQCKIFPAGRDAPGQIR